MDEQTRNALINDAVVDITTMGRRSGQSAAHRDMGPLSGQTRCTSQVRPGRRGWYANLLASPDFTLHIKQSFQRDIPAKATPVTAETQRRAVFNAMMESLPRLQNLRANFDLWLEDSPLVEVELPS